MVQGPAVSLVTNLPAPYRTPVWEALSQRCALTVFLLAADAPNRGWSIPDDSGIFRRLRTTSISWGETQVFGIRGQLPPEIRSSDAVILGSWESPAYWQLRWACHRERIPVVVFAESTLRSQRFSRGPVAWARGAFFRSADSVVAVGPASRDAVLAMGVPAARIHMSFNAVDVSRFNQGAAESRTWSDDGHRFLYVGQLIPRKNVASLVRAFHLVAESHDTLTVAGTGPLRDDLVKMAHQLGCQDSVSFIGHVQNDELPGLYGAHDTLVLPSTQEVWGLVVNEALASGLHVVVSRAAGVVESVNQMSGVTVVGQDVESIAEGLVTSRKQWTGPVVDPEILAFGPEELALTLASAVTESLRQ